MGQFMALCISLRLLSGLPRRRAANEAQIRDKDARARTRFKRETRVRHSAFRNLSAIQ